MNAPAFRQKTSPSRETIKRREQQPTAEYESNRLHCYNRSPPRSFDKTTPRETIKRKEQQPWYGSMDDPTHQGSKRE